MKKFDSNNLKCCWLYLLSIKNYLSIFVFFFALTSCNSESSIVVIDPDKPQIKEQENNNEFGIIGEWSVFEDQNLTKEFGTLTFKSNGEAIMINPGIDPKVGIYSFDLEQMTLSLSDPNGELGELAKVRIIDNNHLMLTIGQSSGIDYISHLIRVN